MTGHKSQGGTISYKVIVDIRNAFAPELTYAETIRTSIHKSGFQCIAFQNFNHVKLDFGM